MTKRTYGDGSITKRGKSSFRLRYRIGKQRYSVTFQGTPAEARQELRRLLHSGDTGEHVAPDKATLASWATLGHYKLQEIDAADIDRLYVGLETKLHARTALHVHSVLNACLCTAVRTRKLAINPMNAITKVPHPGGTSPKR